MPLTLPSLAHLLNSCILYISQSKPKAPQHLLETCTSVHSTTQHMSFEPFRLKPLLRTRRLLLRPYEELCQNWQIKTSWKPTFRKDCLPDTSLHPAQAFARMRALPELVVAPIYIYIYKGSRQYALFKAKRHRSFSGTLMRADQHTTQRFLYWRSLGLQGGSRSLLCGR